MMDDFVPFPKLGRMARSCVITEKLDGTNAQIVVSDDGTQLRAGSRNRWITPEADNYGFARWVEDHRDELLTLGPGRHYGEWWGKGIQRGYGLAEKRFSLFNSGRWSNPETRPACCGVVPVIAADTFTTALVDAAIYRLTVEGSLAAPGFKNPEGVVVFHSATGTMFKRTVENDAQPKSAATHAFDVVA